MVEVKCCSSSAWGGHSPILANTMCLSIDPSCTPWWPLYFMMSPNDHHFCSLLLMTPLLQKLELKFEILTKIWNLCHIHFTNVTFVRLTLTLFRYLLFLVYLIWNGHHQKGWFPPHTNLLTTHAKPHLWHCLGRDSICPIVHRPCTDDVVGLLHLQFLHFLRKYFCEIQWG